MKYLAAFSRWRASAYLFAIFFLAATPLHAQRGLTKPAAASTSVQRFTPDKLGEIDAAIEQAIADQKCPGGVVWLERDGAVYNKAYGRRAVQPDSEPATLDTIYDAASLTKVCATTPAIMILVERQRVNLDAPVSSYIPEFSQNGKEGVTVRHLMTHTSGLRAGIGANSSWSGYEGAIQKACAEKLQSTPGTQLVYSDINYFVLGEVVRRVSGQGLHEFVAKEIYQRLKMKDTGYLPGKEKLSRIAPTEPDANGNLLRGVVHDPTARQMGGVAGHAGLFTTAPDLARFARMLLNEGELDGVRIMKPETVKLMTTVQTPEAVDGRRGLGWDIDSSFSGPRGKHFPLGSYGHTGWTGTSLWIDPFSKTFIMFLSNRNHPNGKGNVLALRSALGTLAAEAVTDYDFNKAPAGALAPRPRRAQPKQVLNGI
ncbi:MAG: serine hydrolase domain-containing protein, partial [Limisphaerales bacterium]